eukprot:gnl/TRDRNA2_/TRDRNA2_175164_c7_seq11.p1 gnl/TRDRNA2_/TRDRNA2_175164_c7~~gnl/TRDRNA2_/TRDRNA2_175164_c7_seq11.p1  ORF type:complete len:406 (-),score=158.32 gnl/TRDRNA2_/TRDRNA2_175164_c7_seq11:141-1229(-)
MLTQLRVSHQRSHGVHTRNFIKQARAVHKQGAKTLSRSTAYKNLAKLASKFHSLGLAQVAVMVRTGGHFDKVIEMIDKMIQVMRDEEAADIEHKDRCEAQQSKNANDMEDLKHDIGKTEEKIGRMEDNVAEYKKKIEECEAQIGEVETQMKEMLDERNEEYKLFQKALDDDLKAKALLEAAIDALSSFYKKNKIPLNLLQGKGPEYSVDKDKAPSTTFGSSHGGSKSESGGLIAILSMLVEDTQKEIDAGRAEDAENQKEYEAERDAAQAMYDSIEASKVKHEKNLADKEADIEDAKEFKGQKGEDLGSQEDLAKTLSEDCDWIKEQFADRNTKRKAEIEGLMDAKNILGGAEPDDELQMVD